MALPPSSAMTTTGTDHAATTTKPSHSGQPIVADGSSPVVMARIESPSNPPTLWNGKIRASHVGPDSSRKSTEFET